MEHTQHVHLHGQLYGQQDKRTDVTYIARTLTWSTLLQVLSRTNEPMEHAQHVHLHGHLYGQQDKQTDGTYIARTLTWSTLRLVLSRTNEPMEHTQHVHLHGNLYGQCLVEQTNRWNIHSMYTYMATFTASAQQDKRTNETYIACTLTWPPLRLVLSRTNEPMEHTQHVHCYGHLYGQQDKRTWNIHSMYTYMVTFTASRTNEPMEHTYHIHLHGHL